MHTNPMEIIVKNKVAYLIFAFLWKLLARLEKRVHNI